MTEGREQIRLLRALQELESEMTALNKRRQQNLDTKNEIESALAASQTLVTQGSEELERLKKTYREMEFETRMANDQVRKLNTKLNMVKTNKEYHALLKEIEEIKRDVSHTEDRMLMHLEGVEAKEATLRDHADRLSQTEVKSAEDCAQIDQDNSQCQERLAMLAESRRGLMDQLPAALRNMYQRVVNSQSNGVAVAPVVSAVCGGCNVNIPPQMFNELQRCDSVQLCPSCQRIIYWPSCCDGE